MGCPSARVFENEGFPAIATSSAGLMVSLGYPDGEVMGRPEFVSAVERIAMVLSVPLSVVIVAGSRKTTKEVVATVKAMVNAGGIGISIEELAPATKTLMRIKRMDEH